MKKLFLVLAAAVMTFGTAIAQEVATAAAEQPATEVVAETVNAETALAGESLHYVLMQKFLEGGWGWMLPILIALVLGLAIAIERILYLAFSSINTKKFMAQVEAALANGGVEAAKEVCRNTRGPIASIFTQAFIRLADGQSLEEVEKSVVSYGGVEASKMEQNLSWISLFIAIAPSLGFLGTVIGMIQAFDAIMVAGDMSPAVVAGGMKVALITTVGGLIVAVILQIFFNYILSQVESLTIDMEDASISLMDILVKYQK